MIITNSDTLKPQYFANEIFESFHWSIQKIFKVEHKNIKKLKNDLLDTNKKKFLMKIELYNLKLIKLLNLKL